MYFRPYRSWLISRADIELKVLQIARNERSRAGLEQDEKPIARQSPAYSYNYELLFDRYWEDISLPGRTQALLRQAIDFKPDVINLTGYYDPAQLLLLVWAKARGSGSSCRTKVRRPINSGRAGKSK